MSESRLVRRAGPEARAAAAFYRSLNDAAERHGIVTLACTYRCASGGRRSGEWRGVPVADLLADAPPETTHLRAVSADGYRAPVAIPDALTAIVATERLDEASDGLPRLIGESIPGPRTVQNLVRLEPVAFPPGSDTDPEWIDDPDAVGHDPADTPGVLG
ncbi:molybdopterin-binding protein [Halorubrum vacuolatum]|uniref:Uncharacterized protein n=1 Tax=Halorubrum vacuolatum TaxID=63740 RepID=A0A238V949_HALVU|nr:hypothetical protein [Halorubrum vacuolatum]SNR30577.1 hypothetical protein SAMN06264855_10280 [Halorubrum vacuolatum]